MTEVESAPKASTDFVEDETSKSDTVKGVVQESNSPDEGKAPMDSRDEKPGDSLGEPAPPPDKNPWTRNAKPNDTHGNYDCTPLTCLIVVLSRLFVHAFFAVDEPKSAVNTVKAAGTQTKRKPKVGTQRTIANRRSLSDLSPLYRLDFREANSRI